MKKTTNSNPLKYFNDAAAARAKSVIAGNNKLMKAQDGIVQGPFQKSTTDRLDKKYPGTAFTPPKGPYSATVLQNMKENVARPRSYGWSNPADLEKRDRENEETDIREEGRFKKGGAVKSKKK